MTRCCGSFYRDIPSSTFIDPQPQIDPVNRCESWCEQLFRWASCQDDKLAWVFHQLVVCSFTLYLSSRRMFLARGSCDHLFHAEIRCIDERSHTPRITRRVVCRDDPWDKAALQFRSLRKYMPKIMILHLYGFGTVSAMMHDDPIPFISERSLTDMYSYKVSG